MDGRLPVESMDAVTLRMLLSQERLRRAEVEGDLRQMQAGITRQNERIMALERIHAQQVQHIEEQQGVIRGLLEQNRLLREQVATLQRAVDGATGVTHGTKPLPGEWPSTRTKQDTPPKPRRKRAARHNHGRQRSATVDEPVRQSMTACPRCGTRLAGGWVHRRVQVIEVPPRPQARVTEHLLVARHCPHCRIRVVPPPPGLATGRVGQCRFGPRLLASIATMATVERLPIRQIQARLRREYGVALSVGGITGLLRRVAQHGGTAYTQLGHDLAGSPVLHADETGWREDGIPGYIWTLSSPQACLFHYEHSRAGTVIDELLAPDFAGVLVSDFYGVYDHLSGSKQRCWAHLWRDIDALQGEYPDDQDLATWVTGVRIIYDLARAERPVWEEGMLPRAVAARSARARRAEGGLLALCPVTLPATAPHATLAKRIRRYLPELFTFVRELDVPATNNAAERSLRPLVVARKISGGTRSPQGSHTRMVLASLAATARLRDQDPAAVFLALFQPDAHTL